MKKVILIVLFIVFLLTRKSDVILAVGLPPTPTQETLERLREMGRQNELKYGSGTEEQIQPTASPTPTPTPIPTKIPKPTKIPTPIPKSQQIKQQFMNFFHKMIRLIFR